VSVSPETTARGVVNATEKLKLPAVMLFHRDKWLRVSEEPAQLVQEIDPFMFFTPAEAAVHATG